MAAFVLTEGRAVRLARALPAFGVLAGGAGNGGLPGVVVSVRRGRGGLGLCLAGPLNAQ